MYIRYKHIAYFILAALLMIACNENEIENVTQDKVAFAAGVDKYSTRLSQDGSQWTEGDQIGVYSFPTGATTTAHFSNVIYAAGSTAAATVFNPVNEPITYPKDGSAVDFIAYYPYHSAMSSDIYPIDLSDQTASLVAHDLMYAKSNNGGSGHTEEAVVSLGFTHQLTKIIINLVNNEDGEPVTPDEDGVAIKGMNTTANFNLKTGVLSGATTSTDILPYMNENSIEAILLPFTVADGHEFAITVSGNKFLWKISDKFSTLDMKAGYSYTFKVTVNTSDIVDVELVQFDGSSISPWGDGGGDAQEPTEPEEPNEPEEIEDFNIPADYTVITPSSETAGSIRTAIQGATDAKVAIKLAAGNYTESGKITVPATVKSLLIVGEVGATKPVIITKELLALSEGDIDLVHLYNVELAGTDVAGGYFSNHNSATKMGTITFEHCIVHDFRGVMRVRTNAEIGKYQIVNSIFYRIGGYNLLTLEDTSKASVVELSKSTFYHLGSRGLYLRTDFPTAVTVDQCTFHQGPYYAIAQFTHADCTLEFTKNLIGAEFDITDTSVSSNGSERGISIRSGGKLVAESDNYYATNTKWLTDPIGTDCGFTTGELFKNPVGIDFTQSKVKAGDPRWY